jgi:molybdenum cofactor guanylyltransferase
MHSDKAALVYHDKPQAEYSLDLLRPHCQQAFLSCRQDQANQGGFIGLPQIHDTFLDMGPMSGILSALRAYPGAAFLVIACDLPLLDAPSLAALVKARTPSLIATAFTGPQNGLPEPLCAIYEPGCYATLLEFLGRGITCPRKVLIHSKTSLHLPPDLNALVNANDPEAYQDALKMLRPT